MKIRLIALVLCAALFLMPCVSAYSDKVLPTPVIPNLPIAMPRPSEPTSSVMSSIDDMEKTTELYNNFISMPAEMFLWSKDGIKASTGILTDEQYNYLKNLADSLTSGCKTPYEKIQNITMYIAVNIGFDYDYYTHGTNPYPASDPYSTVISGYAVCAGYAKTMEALLQMVGVPCVYIESPGHAWNLIYTGERWILVDVTWMSNSRYEYGSLYKSEKVNIEWFDFSFLSSATQKSHIINKIPYAQLGEVLVSYPVHTSMAHIIWREDVSEIGESAFYGGAGFAGDLVIPSGVTKIGDKAFYGCSGFDGALVLPDSVTEIGYGAFRNCTGLTGDLVIPSGVEWVENYAFYGCTGFDGSLTLPSGLKIIGTHAFRDCRFTGELILPEELETLGVFAFSGCKFTGKLVIPQSLTSIARSAFRECDFTEVVIHEGVTAIVGQAFYGCDELTAVYFEGDAPEIYEVSSEGTGSFPTSVTLRVREGTVGWIDSAYYNAELGTYKGYRLGVLEETKKFSITASVMSYNPTIGVSVILISDGESVYTYETEPSEGNGKITSEINLTEVPAGEYDLVITKAGHLSYTVNGILIEEDVILDLVIELVAGDVNGDGCVDLRDVALLTSSDTYGRSADDAGTKAADINGDGCFDLSDLSIITSEKNYGKSATVTEYVK